MGCAQGAARVVCWPLFCASCASTSAASASAPEAELQGLLRGQHADGAPSLEKSVEGQLGGQNGRERHQDERDDERHAALFVVRFAQPSMRFAHPVDGVERDPVAIW